MRLEEVAGVENLSYFDVDAFRFSRWLLLTHHRY